MAAARKRHDPGAFHAHIKKGDNVLVLAGRSAGDRGRITQVLPRNERAIVEGANLVTRHQRARGGQPRATAEQQSGRIEKPAPIHVSNLMVICPQCNRPTRIGHRVEEGKSVRVCKQDGCGEPIDRRK
jgi:large subunit ribosomal protein L24